MSEESPPIDSANSNTTPAASNSSAGSEKDPVDETTN